MLHKSYALCMPYTKQYQMSMRQEEEEEENAKRSVYANENCMKIKYKI